MSALLENAKDRLLARIRNTPDLDPFKDLVTGTDETPGEILGYNPTIYSEELTKLHAICQNFRRQHAPKGGIVVVQGERGAGKTTLLHRLRHERTRDLILRPTHYRSDRPFPQYLLQELVAELDRRAQKDETSPIDLISTRLAVEVVYRKLEGFTEPEWLREYLQWEADQDWFSRKFREWKAHWGLWTRQDLAVRNGLLQEMRPQDGSWNLAALQSYPFTPHFLEKRGQLYKKEACLRMRRFPRNFGI